MTTSTHSKWVPPSEQCCKEALIGTSNVLMKLYNKSFEPRLRQLHSSDFFRHLQIVNDADWMLHKKITGQTFESFWKTKIAFESKLENDKPGRPRTAIGFLSDQNQRTNAVKTIYIIPIGNFPSRNKVGNDDLLIVWLQTFCSAFFQLAKVKILPDVQIADIKCEYRVNELTGKFQLNASNIVAYLKKIKPSNADCVIAVTMVDLFPKKSWDFVFGYSSIFHGVGVYSFARLDDFFYETWTQGNDKTKRFEDGRLDYSPFSKPLTKEDTELKIKGNMFLRTCKVISHEICQMFGMKLCVYYSCLMNGSNHIQEYDRKPLYLCPICLRKLHAVMDFNVTKRYKELLAWLHPRFWETYRHQENPSKQTTCSEKGSSLPEVCRTMPSVQRLSISNQRKLSRQCVSGKSSIRGVGPQKSIVNKLDYCKNLSHSKSLCKVELIDKTQSISNSLKGHKVSSPPMDAFTEYSKWLANVIEFLEK